MCLSILLLGCCALSSAAPLVANTTHGPVLGVTEVSDSGAVVNSWRGIPFAADTSGANRFMPPQPRAPWGPTPLNCTLNGPGCRQPHHNPVRRPHVAGSLLARTAHAGCVSPSLTCTPTPPPTHTPSRTSRATATTGRAASPRIVST